MIKVHQKQFPEGYNPWDTLAEEDKVFNPDWDGRFEKYVHVANVDTSDLDEVFLFSNHPDREHYGYDKAFEYLGDVPARSVSVSDILETEDGKFFYVAPVGFEEIKCTSEGKAL